MAATWTEFSGSTTVHGLRFVNSESSLKRRIIWLTLVLTGLAFFSTQFFASLTKYFDYQVNTVVYLSNDGNTKFPAITVCNQNALRRSKLEENKDDPTIRKLLLKTKQYKYRNGSVNANSNLSDTRVTGQQMRELYFKYGHNMESIENGGMLEFCRTPDASFCFAKDFVRTLTYSGLCYTLNSGRIGLDGKKGKGIYSALSGRLASVKLILSVQVEEYSDAIGSASSAGIVVLIHDQLDPPIADTHGMMIGPGKAASIAIKKQKLKSLKYPYASRCDDEELAPDYPYSRQGCLRKCQERFAIKRCKCRIGVDTITNETDIEMCDMDQNFKCAIPAATEWFQREKDQCECPFACESTEYMPTLSYSLYPSNVEGRNLAIKELNTLKKNITAEAIKERISEIRKNKISLDIFYHQLDYLTMQQVPASTPVGTFGEIGGLLGISLGASFLTVIEILDFLVIYIGNKVSKQNVNQTSVAIVEENNMTSSAL